MQTERATGKPGYATGLWAPCPASDSPHRNVATSAGRESAQNPASNKGDAEETTTDGEDPGKASGQRTKAHADQGATAKRRKWLREPE